jgi:hypothetical protein
MRLTLRTLLAYLDDILEPSDAQQLGSKITESKFAADLVSRIRTSICRARLPAPKLEGKGMGLDANTVAEYLDNTLPADRVPDFEKVCLESDIHLAEVAASHQILTLVLGEPADVPSRVRDRVYRLAALDVPAAAAAGAHLAAEPEAAAHTAAGNNGAEKSAEAHADAARDSTRLVEPPDEPNASKPRTKPEVPDYLLATRRPALWPVPLALVLVFGLVIVGLRVIGPFTDQHPLWRLLAGSGTQVAAGDGSENKPSPARGGSAEPSAAAKNNGNPQGGEQAGDGRQDGEPPNESSTTPMSVVPADNVTLPGEEIRPVVPGESTTPVGPSAEPPVPAPAVDGAGGAPTPMPRPAEPVAPMPVAPGTAPPVTVPADAAVTPPAPATGGAGEPRLLPGIDVGRFISDEQVLAVEKPGGTWMRLPAIATLVSGDRLLALPSYRPQLALAPGIQVTLSGPALVQLAPPIAEGIPAIQMEYGRAILVTSGGDDAQVSLRLGNREGVARFNSALTTIAVEVTHYLPPGTNPEVPEGSPQPALAIARIYAANGPIEWSDADGVSTIEAGQMRLLAGDAPGRTVSVKSAPEWLSSASGAEHPDRLASQIIGSFLKPEAAIRLTLNELLMDRRVEVRSLAVRSLSYLGQFEPFVDELSDLRQRSYWDDAFDALKAALARDPRTAASVRAALEWKLGADGAQLFRLLSSYSPEQLEKGGAEELVTLLEHERMAFRVLAYENLRRITGKTQLYRPEVTVSANRPPIQKWRQLLQDKAIVYETPPTPFTEEESSAATPAAAPESAPAAPAESTASSPAAPASPLETPAPKAPAPTTPPPDGAAAAPPAGRNF